MAFKWQDKHMELFIQTYKQYECLWNNKSSDYSKLNEREKAYALMLNDLNIPGVTVADIKSKIKTIRTRYGAELAKIRSSELNAEGGNGNVYEPRLFWFKEADKFLRNVCNSKSSYLMTVKVDKTQPESTAEENETTFTSNNNDDTTSAENSRDSLGPTTSSTNNSKNLIFRKNLLKRPLTNNLPATESGRIKKPKQISEDEIEDDNPNEFDYFCKSLAIQLKRMPLERAIICQQELQSIMTKERLFQLSESFLQNPEDYLAISSTERYSDHLAENETQDSNEIRQLFEVKNEI